ncbi:MAG TPA: SBBP repeat-containing protein [Thermomicrobiales bacterium]
MRAIRHLLHLSRARGLLAALLVALLLPSGASAIIAGPTEPRADPPQETAARDAYGSLPLAFESNEGQGDPAARFLAHGHGYTLALAPDALTLGLPTPLRFTFPGANPAPAMRAEQPLPGVVNSFIGNDPTRWHAGISTSARVRYTGLYPGLDLVVYGTNNGGWEYDVVVAPGADPAAFALSVDGATGVTLDATTGDLVLTMATGEVRQHAPTIYQDVDGERRIVAGGYAMRDDGTVGFRVGEYDPSLPLVIDPTLVYSTFLGGSGNDEGTGIAVDTGGSVYVTGYTKSTNFPVTNGSTLNGSQDAFVTKLDTTGTRVYSTYLGGSADDWGNGIAVDASGNAYVTGRTYSTNFPVTNGSTLNGTGTTTGSNGDAFVTSLGANGVRRSSTYLGGSGHDEGAGIAVDTGGNAYVTGITFSTNFPVTNGSTYGGAQDVFVTKLNGSGGRVYSTYLGGSGDDEGGGIAVDTGGNAYVTGKTQSTNFPVTDGSTIGGDQDAFVTRLDGNGARVYSTYLGGRARDLGTGIAVDTSGNAYVTGITLGVGFPVTDGSTPGGSNDAFVTEFNGSGVRIYSTYLGGIADDAGTAIAVDTGSNVYITGYTNSTNFPVTNGSTFSGGGYDAFVTKIAVTPPPIPNPLPPPQPHPAPSGPPASLPQARPTVPVISAPNPLPARRP